MFCTLAFCQLHYLFLFFFFFQAEDGIRDLTVTGVQTCALPILAVLPLFAAPIAHARDDHWTFEVAAGGGVTPRYSGSEEYRATPSLSFDVTSPGGWFLGTSGIGWGTSIGEHTRVRAYVGASGIRKEKDSLLGGSDFLRGM